MVHGGGRSAARSRTETSSPQRYSPTLTPRVHSARTRFGSGPQRHPLRRRGGSRPDRERHEIGLAGYVWTTDLGRAHRVAELMDAGYVSVNGMALLPPGAPFGGWKASGHGVEGPARACWSTYASRTCTCNGRGLSMDDPSRWRSPRPNRNSLAAVEFLAVGGNGSAQNM